MDPHADLKRQAAEYAVRYVKSGMAVGLGTGSTAIFAVRYIGELLRTGALKDIVAFATSRVTAEEAVRLNISMLTDDLPRSLDVTIDGADEVDPQLNLIKGGGGALLREKLVWEASRRCVVIADAAKRVPRLGKAPLPIEVAPFGHEATALRICDALAECDLGAAPRLRIRDGEVVVTDNGNVIYDAACGAIEEPSMLADALKSVTGVIDHGLFLDLADEALIATDKGVERLTP